MYPLLTPRGLLTLDPDQFGQAKFCQSEAIDEFLIFELLDLSVRNMHKYHSANYFSFKNYIYPLLTPRGLLTLDPDQFGQAKFRQSEAIDEFLIFEIFDLA